MTTLIVCIKRKPGMSAGEFLHYWRDTHAPLLLSCTEFTRHLVSYTQYPVATGGDAAAQFGVTGDFDGVARLKFREPDGMAEAFAEPEYLARIRPDEAHFIDIDACVSIVTGENRVI